MRKIKLLIVAIFTSSLIACIADSNSTPTITEQQVGISASSTPAPTTFSTETANKTIPDLLLSDASGKSMDEQDRINIQQALITIPVGKEAVWTNMNTKIAYTVIPVNEYRSGSAFCRQSQITISNEKQTTYTTICKGPDGKWYVKQ